MGNEEFPFDDELAESYVGKYILVGITYFDSGGVELRRQQLHGVIESASRDGIAIVLHGVYDGRRWNMPPVLAAIRQAAPGVYELHTTKETIENPDLLATWSVTEPSAGGTRQNRQDEE